MLVYLRLAAQRPRPPVSATGIDDIVHFSACDKGYTEWVPSLHDAAENGHIQIVRQLLSQLSTRIARDLAVRQRRVVVYCREAPSSIAFAMSEFINACDLARGETALHMAVNRGDGDIAAALVKCGLFVNARDTTGYTALHIAVDNSDVDVVKLLLKLNADPNQQDLTGNTPLHRLNVVDGRSTDVFKLLVVHGASVNVANILGVTPLHLALKRGAGKQSLQQFADYGANFKAKDIRGNTMIHIAGKSLQRPVLACIIANGVSINERNCDGKTALHLACSSVDISLITLLLEHGASTNVVDNNNSSPLHSLMLNSTKQSEGHFEQYDIAVRLLIIHGADCDMQTSDTKSTPLHFACTDKSGLSSDPMVFLKSESLFNHADVSLPDNLGNSCVHQLLEHHCVHNNDIVDVIFQRKNGKLIHATNCFGESVAHKQALGGSISWNCCPALADLRAARDVLQRTPLHTYCTSSACRFFTFNGDLNDLIANRDFLGRSPLHHLCIAHADEIDPQLLIAIMQTGLNERDAFGRTPLHYAALYQNMHFFSSLRSLGADECLVDNDGVSPKEMALAIDAPSQLIRTSTAKVVAFDAGLYRKLKGRYTLSREVTPDRILVRYVDNEPTSTSQRQSPYFEKQRTNGGVDIRVRPGEHGTVPESVNSQMFPDWIGVLEHSREDDVDACIRRAVRQFVNRLLKHVGENDNRLTSTCRLVGSAEERVSVGICNEFDFFIVLSEFESIVQPESDDLVSGFLRLRSSQKHDLHAAKFRDFFDENMFLMPRFVRQTFFTSIIKALHCTELWEDGYFEYLMSRCINKSNGPAITLKLAVNRLPNGRNIYIHTHRGGVIMVDLVPAIRLASHRLTSSTAFGVFVARTCDVEDATAFAVMKSPAAGYAVDAERHNSQTLCRISFVLPETVVLKNCPPSVKAAYMLLLLLFKELDANTKQNDTINKYTIKTCVLHCIVTGVFDPVPDRNDLTAASVKACFHILLEHLCWCIQDDAVESASLPGHLMAVWNMEPFPHFYKWAFCRFRQNPLKPNDERVYRGLLAKWNWHFDDEKYNSIYIRYALQSNMDRAQRGKNVVSDALQMMHSACHDPESNCSLPDVSAGYEVVDGSVEYSFGNDEEIKFLRYVAEGHQHLPGMTSALPSYNVHSFIQRGECPHLDCSRWFETFGEWI